MIKFRLERSWSCDGYQLWIIEYRNGKSYICKPVELEFIEVDSAAYLPDPTLKVDGILARDMLPELKKSLAGFTFEDKEEYEVSRRIEKAMQAHIDSLKLVVERAVK